MITQEYLKSILHYDEETGLFTWIVNKNRGARIGMTAGRLVKGYVAICINRKNYYAHRLAWIYVYGKFPPNQLDHINLIKNDNRLCNLREATASQNLRNRKKLERRIGEYKNVYLDKRYGTWFINVNLDGHRTTFSGFKTKEFAWEIYKNVSRYFHGEFDNVEL